MGKRTTIWIVYGILFLFLATSASAQYLSQVGESVTDQLSGIRDWYTVQGYSTNEDGKQVRVYDPEYAGIRIIIDFILVFLLVGLSMRNVEYVKKMGKFGPAIVAFIVSFGLVFAGQTGFITRLLPLVLNLPFLAAAFALFLIIEMVFKKKDAGTGTKVSLFILAIIIMFLLTFFMTRFGPTYAAGDTLGIKGSISASDQFAARWVPGLPPPAVSGTPAGATGTDQTTSVYDRAQAKLNEAQQHFNAGRYSQAKTSITDAKKLNTDGLASVGDVPAAGLEAGMGDIIEQQVQERLGETAANTYSWFADRFKSDEEKKQALKKSLDDQKKKINELERKINEKLGTTGDTAPPTPPEGQPPTGDTGTAPTQEPTPVPPPAFDCPTVEEAGTKINSDIMSIMQGGSGKQNALSYINTLEQNCVGQKGITQSKLDSWKSSVNSI